MEKIKKYKKKKRSQSKSEIEVAPAPLVVPLRPSLVPSNLETSFLCIFSFLSPTDLCTSALATKDWAQIIKKNNLIGIAVVRDKLKERNCFVSDAVIFQIFKLKKFDVSESVALLEDYASFRKQQWDQWENPEEAIQKEVQTRKALWFGHDKKGRPTIIIRPRFHLAGKRNPTLLYAVHMFENACDVVWKTQGVSDFVVILDFEGFGMKNFDMNFARTFIAWSRKYYKNLLGACLCINSPRYALFCWGLVKIFVPAETLKKIVIAKNEAEGKKALNEVFEPSQIPEIYGGTAKAPHSFLLDGKK